MLEQTWLHRTFAYLSHEKDDILRFTQRFGQLFDSLEHVEESVWLDAWRKESIEMNTTIHLWNQIRSKRSKDPLLDRVELKCRIDAHLKDKVSLVVDPNGAGFKLTYVSKNLLTALWLQFSHAVTQNKEYRGCARRGCDIFFELSPPTVRKSRLFCSNACKSRDYRDKQDEARRMYTRKKSFKEISEAIGSDISVIRRWVQGK